MLGLVLIYWVGKTFYKLAETYGKNKWLFAILGVVSYYGGLLGGGFALGFILAGVAPDFLNRTSEIELTIMCIVLGVITCIGFYQILKYNWKKNAESNIENSEVIDEVSALN